MYRIHLKEWNVSGRNKVRKGWRYPVVYSMYILGNTYILYTHMCTYIHTHMCMCLEYDKIYTKEIVTLNDLLSVGCVRAGVRKWE